MPLHPQVEELLAQMAGMPPISSHGVAEARAAAEMGVVMNGDPIPVASVRDIVIPVGDAEIGARVYTPEGAGPHPVVEFIHGGGWVICSLDTHDNLARAICRDSAALVVSLDYRMAPEHPFPTAPEDCFAATSWVAAHASEFNGDASRLALSGDSAGGNLSAVVTQMARDAGGPVITVAALIYPAVDMTATDESLDENATGYFLERADMDWFYDLYVPVDQRTDPRASPALHPELGGLPPCLIVTCEFDPLRDEGERYAAALRANGVDVTARRFDGLIHAAATMTGVLDGGRELVAEVTAYLRAALHD